MAPPPVPPQRPTTSPGVVGLLSRSCWASLPIATIESLIEGGHVAEFTTGQTLYAEADTGTGLVQVRRAQVESRGRGAARVANMLFDEEWTEWLPIYAWTIAHDEGVIIVDTGETARVPTHRTTCRSSSAAIRATSSPATPAMIRVCSSRGRLTA
jgi:hypothetical protein